jgi:hypothetical protein
MPDFEEMFVREYTSNGFKGTPAYLKIRPQTNYEVAGVQACRLLKKDRIRELIELEKDKMHVKSLHSKEKLFREMHEVREKALKKNKLQTSLNATVEKAKLAGHYRDQETDLTSYTAIMQQIVVNVNSEKPENEADRVDFPAEIVDNNDK